MKFTKKEIDIISEFLRIGEPLPKEFKERLIFQGDDSAADEETHIKHPLIHEHFKGLIGQELQRLGLFDKMRMIAPSDISALIEGERGTGKKLIAKMIHEMGPRVNSPFIIVDCSSIPEDISEGLLLGHIRGAFPAAYKEKTGLIENANRGTIVFNEVDKLPTKCQAIVLRFLQNKRTWRLGGTKQIPVDARVIATSHQDLKMAIKEGRFIVDLYFRINSVTLSIPPLRERRGDILALADFFLLKYAKQSQKRIVGFTSNALQALWCHDWLGNVTELENRIKGAVAIAMDTKIKLEDLGADIPNEYTGIGLKEARNNLERELILKALSRHRNSITKACKDLDISRPTIYGLMNKLKIPRPQ
jgi:two-component system NtrC family response regulator